MDVNYKYALLSSAAIIGISLYFNNIFNIKNYEKRTQLLMTHGNTFFLDSDQIKKYRESLNSDLVLEHNDIEIMNHIKMFNKHYSKEELLIMRNNLQKLNVNYNSGSIFSAGSYNPRSNTITLSPLLDKDDKDFKYKKALNHEVHHMSSNLGIIGNFIICGFEQIYTKNGVVRHIGKGINEGYTEYLSKNMVKSKSYSYDKIVDLIPLIELFYDDKNELRNNYFNADLPIVIKKFSGITSMEQATELIREIDRLCFYDTYKTWFDRTDEIEIDVRTKLYDYYKKYSGCLQKEDLFFTDNMLEKVEKQKLLKKKK